MSNFRLPSLVPCSLNFVVLLYWVVWYTLGSGWVSLFTKMLFLELYVFIFGMAKGRILPDTLSRLTSNLLNLSSCALAFEKRASPGKGLCNIIFYSRPF